MSLIFGVILVTVIVQIIDNNILVPLVVSSKVEINAIASIVGIFAGGMLAGIAGMFLAIPMIAILKVIFDNVPALSPWGYLIGDDLPKIPQWYKKVPYLANMKVYQKLHLRFLLLQQQPLIWKMKTKWKRMKNQKMKKLHNYITIVIKKTLKRNLLRV